MKSLKEFVFLCLTKFTYSIKIDVENII